VKILTIFVIYRIVKKLESKEMGNKVGKKQALYNGPRTFFYFKMLRLRTRKQIEIQMLLNSFRSLFIESKKKEKSRNKINKNKTSSL
jgi:hypothetical protein